MFSIILYKLLPVEQNDSLNIPMWNRTTHSTFYHSGLPCGTEWLTQHSHVEQNDSLNILPFWSSLWNRMTHSTFPCGTEWLTQHSTILVLPVEQNDSLNIPMWNRTTHSTFYHSGPPCGTEWLTQHSHVEQNDSLNILPFWSSLWNRMTHSTFPCGTEWLTQHSTILVLPVEQNDSLNIPMWNRTTHSTFNHSGSLQVSPCRTERLTQHSIILFPSFDNRWDRTERLTQHSVILVLYKLLPVEQNDSLNIQPFCFSTSFSLWNRTTHSTFNHSGSLQASPCGTEWLTQHSTILVLYKLLPVEQNDSLNIQSFCFSHLTTGETEQKHSVNIQPFCFSHTYSCQLNLTHVSKPCGKTTSHLVTLDNRWDHVIIYKRK